MPGKDGTGPSGTGPMTGRGSGYCAVYLIPGYANPVRGYGRGFCRGWGRGFVSQQAYAPITQPQFPEQEVAALEDHQKKLKAEKTDLEQELEGVRARIEELKAKQGSK
jgi:hypothetical protein